jgi:hypothetical protein
VKGPSAEPNDTLIMEEGQKSDPSLEGGPDGAPRRKEAQEEYTEESHGEVHGEAQEE